MRSAYWETHRCNRPDLANSKTARLYKRIKDKSSKPKTDLSQKALAEFAKLGLDPKHKPGVASAIEEEKDPGIIPIAVNPNQPLASVMDDQRPMEVPLFDEESLIDASYAATYHQPLVETQIISTGASYVNSSPVKKIEFTRVG